MLRWIRVHDDVSEAMEDKSGHCGVGVGKIFGGAIGVLMALIINIMNAQYALRLSWSLS